MGEEQRILLRGFGDEYTWLGDDVYSSRPRKKIDKEINLKLYSPLLKKETKNLTLYTPIKKSLKENKSIKISIQQNRKKDYNITLRVNNKKLLRILKAM